MKKSLFILPLISLFLFACDDGVNEIPQITDPVETNGETIFNTLTYIKNNTNYTLEISDYGAEFTQYFNTNAYSFQFSDQENINGYIEDSKGIYEAYVNYDGKLEVGYYLNDDYGNPLRGIYQNFTYAFSDLSLDNSLYSINENNVILKDLEGEEALVYFYLFGYVDSEETPFSAITSIEFNLDTNNNVVLSLTFDETLSSYGTSMMTIKNIESTTQPEIINNYINSNEGGKVRVDTSDKLYTYLANLKNLRNFTLQIESDYKEVINNYTMTNKYMKNAYYSVSSREGENDLGYIQTSEGVKELLVDAINNKTIIGDLISNSNGEVYQDLYDDVLFSFITTSWNPYSFEARVLDEDTYIIDDLNYIVETGNLTGAYAFSFEIDHLELTYNEVDNTYLFDFVFTNGDHIYMSVIDIGTTVIGDLTIE